MRRLKLFLLAALLLHTPAFASEAAAPPAEVEGIPIILLVNLSNGQVLYERNADRRFIPASITKVMSLFTAFEMIKAGHLDENQRFGFQGDSFAQWRQKGSTMFIGADASLKVAELMRGIATVSANDASVILAEGAAGSLAKWAELMNQNAADLGMRNSHFGTPNGWPDEGRTFVSARDLVKLADALTTRHPNLYAKYFGQRELTYGGITQPNRNPILGRVIGADGIKTGFTNQAGFGFLGSARRGDERLAVVVAGADRARDRDRAARALLEWGFNNFEKLHFDFDHEFLGNARVQNGASGKVALATLRPFYLMVPVGTNPRVTMRIDYDGPLRAPIVAGMDIAQLELAIEGMPKSRIPLVAGDDVQQAGFLQRIWNGLIGWIG